MNHQALWKFSVATTPVAEDAVTELLGRVFQAAVVSYTNSQTGQTSVQVYLKEIPRGWRAAMTSGLKAIKRCGLSIAPGKMSWERVRKENWAESWKRHFRPIE